MENPGVLNKDKQIFDIKPLTKKAVESYGIDNKTIAPILLTGMIIRAYKKRETQKGKAKFDRHIQDMFRKYEPETAEILRGDLIGLLQSIESAENGFKTEPPNELIEKSYIENFKLLINFCDIFLNPKKLTNLDSDMVTDAFLTAQMYKIGGSVSRAGFLKAAQVVGLNFLALSTAGNFILNSYQKAVDSGVVETEEGMMLANIRAQEQIPTDELVLYKEDKAKMVNLISEWAVPDEDSKPFPQSSTDREVLKKWLENVSLEAISNTARILMLSNPNIRNKYYGNLTSYLVQEYLPQIFKLTEEVGVSKIAYLQFLTYNGMGTDAIRLNLDSSDLKIQTLLGALNTLSAHRFNFDFPIDLAHTLAYKKTDSYNIHPNMGAYEGIRALYPTGTLIGLEYGALAHGVCILKDRAEDNFRNLESISPQLTKASNDLVESEQDFNAKHQLLVENIIEYCFKIDEQEIKTIWFDILTNPNNDLWAKIGLGNKSKNVPAMLYQFTNFTKAWESIVLNDPNDITIKSLSSALFVGQSDLISISTAYGLREGLKALFFDQLKNPYFRKELINIAQESNNTDLVKILNNFSELDNQVIPFRNSLARAMYVFTKNQFKPDVQNSISIGTASWLDSLSNDPVKYPQISEFRNDPYCRAFCLILCREISGVDGGLVSKDGIRFREVNMPLLALNNGEYSLKLLDKIFSLIKNKITPLYNVKGVSVSRLTLDIACREMNDGSSGVLSSCFDSQEDYERWKASELNLLILKLKGGYIWSGAHNAIKRYLEIYPDKPNIK